MKTWSVPLFSFLLAALFACNYTLNHFYVHGAFMLDSGWFAYLATHATSWPLPNPPAIGGTYFSTHFSPFFYLLTALRQILPGMADPVYFSFTQGVWFGLTAFAVCIFLVDQVPPKTKWLALPISVLAAYNGISLASISFPHFEIAIPGLFLAFLALHFRGMQKSAYAALAFGLLMREDVGLHYFGVFLLLSAGFLLQEKTADSRRRAWFYARLALACLAYAILAISVQKHFFPNEDDALARVYLGSPAFHHVDANFIRDRLGFIAENRLYIFAPLAATLALAAARRNVLYLIGHLASIPWVVFSLAAISIPAGTLTSYYAFPVMIGLLWPCVIHAHLGRPPSFASLIDTSALVVVSIVFFLFGGFFHDNTPWKNFGFQWVGKIEKNQAAAKALLSRQDIPALLVDDTIASLQPGWVSAEQWVHELAFKESVLAKADAFAFQSNAWFQSQASHIIGKAGFVHVCKMNGSNYLLASRRVFHDLECTRINPLPGE